MWSLLDKCCLSATCPNVLGADEAYWRRRGGRPFYVHVCPLTIWPFSGVVWTGWSCVVICGSETVLGAELRPVRYPFEYAPAVAKAMAGKQGKLSA